MNAKPKHLIFSRADAEPGYSTVRNELRSNLATATVRSKNAGCQRGKFRFHVMSAMQVAREFGAEIESLQDELRAAAAHFHLFNGLRNSVPEFETELSKSPLFWSYTQHAHLQAAVISVCRVYDQDRSGSHLGRLLENIKTNLRLFDDEKFWERTKENFAELMITPKGHRPSAERLERDIEFCSVRNPLVATLKKWRDNSIAHKNRRIILGRAAFIENDPLTFEAIQKLIKGGYRILNYYSASFHGIVFSSFPQKQLNDYQEVLRALVHHE